MIFGDHVTEHLVIVIEAHSHSFLALLGFPLATLDSGTGREDKVIQVR